MKDAQTVNKARFLWPLSTLWKFVTICGVFLGLVSGALGLYQWYCHINSAPHMRFEVLSNQCLTNVSSDPRLTSKFKFDGRDVTGLWMSRVQLSNDCLKNIVGSSSQDLMSSNICFSVSQGYKIILVEQESSDVRDIVLDCNAREFTITFGRWKPDQSSIIKVYSEGDRENCGVIGPLFDLPWDPLAQGEVDVYNYKEAQCPNSMINRLPRRISSVISCVGIIIYALILLAVLYWLIVGMGWIKMIRRARWNKMYLSKTLEVLKKEIPEEKHNSRSIALLPADFWITHDIPKPPKDSSFVKEDGIAVSELMPPLIIIVILLFLSGISLASLIYI